MPYAQARLGFTRGVPVGTTVWRLLTRLDADLLATVLAGWLRTRARPATPRPSSLDLGTYLAQPPAHGHTQPWTTGQNKIGP